MGKKKILLIAESNMSLTGVPVVFMSILRELHNDYSFDIVVLKNDDMYFEEEFKSYGGKIYYIDCYKPEGLINSFVWLFSLRKTVKTFLKTSLDINSYSCIHAFNGEFASMLFSLIKRKKNVIKVFQICSADSAYKPKPTIKNALWNICFSGSCKYADKILFASKAALSLNRYKKKGAVLYNYYDETDCGEICECDSNRLSLTQIGTFSSRKNQLFSLRILKLLKEEYPEVVLNLVGKEHESGYLQKINEYISQNELNKNVIFLDSSTKKATLFSETSFVLFPSIRESFGLVLIESQALGVHCFASNTIPNDADMGNVNFLPLVEQEWVKAIIHYYKLNGNKRTKPLEKETFSKDSFKNTILEVYEAKR